MSGASNGTSNGHDDVMLLAMRFAGALYSGAPDSERLWPQLVAAKARPTDTLEIITGASLFAPLPAIDWLCEGLEMAPGAPSVWAGYGFTGKTYAAQALALSVAAGRDVWGSFRCREGTVLHLDYEQGRHLTLRRYQRLARGVGIGPAEVGDRLRVAPLPRLSLASAGAENTLRQACVGVALCIVDSFRAACPEVDENSSEARRPLDALTRISEATGCTMLVIHHARKPSKDAQGGAKMAMRGSSGLFDAAASVLVFEGRMRGEPSRVKHEKARLSGRLHEDFGLEIRDLVDAAGRLDGTEVVTTSTPSGTGRADEGAKIRARILAALDGGPLGANQLETACREGGLEFTASTFRTCRETLLEEGLIVVSAGPRHGKVYCLPEGRS